jgi:hypothetical protein
MEADQMIVGVELLATTWLEIVAREYVLSG